MSVIRTDPLTGFTTIFAPERAKRPIAIAKTAAFDEDIKVQIETDPFAEGKESETTSEVYAVRTSQSEPNQPGWSLRVVANKYPALIPSNDPSSDQNSYGVHEVIVECPQFETQVTRLGLSQFQEIFHAYRNRVAVHRCDPQLNYVIIFKNQGILGGASLGHAHSQLVASQVVPESLSQELETARRYLEQHENSLFSTFSQEMPSGFSGLVTSTTHFNVVCPYASRFAFETWIVPRTLRTHFDDSTDQELDDLAQTSRRLLLALEEILGSHDFNYVIQTPPFDATEESGYAWSLRIYPRLAHLAGFELSTNMFINPVFPEQAIKHLKKQLGP
ncbi:galactose-1-phosphate uridylyltransferase [Gimesia aquarii]|uniref:Galactose-1-phosphate uridylyltransferase n=1 Tax=Gimesia aquarii TaxID=2527964 RepID=A0A517VTN9_9PLAN|nr:DUF4921 family protein [Gimesia aquarii]QDT96339.1 Galactose-1-phosphate uridylyltransferase [Gimesia aquarii]